MSTPHGTVIHVLLVDDHAVVREGYRRLLEAQRDIAVVGEAATAAEALALYDAVAPDIAVMDIALPGISGIEALKRLRSANPDVRVLMFSMYEDGIYASRAMQAGASGYVTKASAPTVLVDAVQAVAGGRRYLSPDIAQELALRAIASDANAPASLSTRELEVLRLLVQGLPIPLIASTLGLTPKTVANHQSNIKQKLGAETPVQLARMGAALLQVSAELP